MTILHHPSDELVLSFASGALAPALALVASVHMEQCLQCRETLRLANSIGGAFLESTPPAALSTDALERALTRLDALPAPASPEPKTMPSSDLPAALRPYEIGSKRWISPGIWISPISRDRAEGTRAYMLGATKGKKLPRHGHHGMELTQVLQGDFFDGDVRYQAGDFMEAGGSHEHRPRVGDKQDCVCIIASEGLPRGLVGLLMRAYT